MSSNPLSTLLQDNPTTNKVHKTIKKSSNTYNKDKQHKNDIMINDTTMNNHPKTEETERTSSLQNKTTKGLETKEMSFQSNDLNSSIKRELHAPKVNYEYIQTTSSFINQEDYRNSLMNICNKRKSASASNKSLPQNTFTREYDNNALFLKNKAKKIDNLRLELSQKEQQECPFKPIINSYSIQLLQRSKTYNLFKNTYEKTTSWKRRVDRKIRHQYTINISKSQERCSFYPFLTDTSIHDRVRNEMKKRKPDYVYQKNIRWLKDVAQRRKEGALEQIEQRMNDQANFRKGNQDAIDRVANSSTERFGVFHKKIKVDLQSDYNNNSNGNMTQTEENKVPEEMMTNIQQLKILITDLNATIEKNKAMKNEDKNSKNKKRSKLVNKQYLIQRYSCINNYDNIHNENSLTLVYNTNNSTIKSIHNMVSKQIKHKIKPKPKPNTNNDIKSYSNPEELNFKYQLLMNKYHNEKQTINTE